MAIKLRYVNGMIGLLWAVCASVGTSVAPAQTSEVVLHNFATSPPRGANPWAGVIRDAAGNFYGTATTGGLHGAGVVYRVDPAGQEMVLHGFTGGADGGYPYAGVIADPEGNLYGTTQWGGTPGLGVVYKLDKAGQETVLYNFTGGADGSKPTTGVILDEAGNLYGTTFWGGTANLGVVYKVDPAGHETVLYNFTGGINGNYPQSGVIRDAAGNLYGTTSVGGAAAIGGWAGYGVVYKLDPAGNETVLYSFMGGSDGSHPYAGVIRDAAGNFYGTTQYSEGSAGWGVVYKLDSAGHETVLYNFSNGPGGFYPYAGVIRDAAGNLYGTTVYDGVGIGGTVYKLDTAGQLTVLHTFTGGTDGFEPYAGVLLDAAGNLYGTTCQGGLGGFGTLYKLDPAGRQTVLLNFMGALDGSLPDAGVIRDADGNLYGTTNSGGTANLGMVYKLDPAGHETVLHNFTGGVDGINPQTGVIRDSAGNLYGTTELGGTGQGVLYKLDAAGEETVLYTFTGGSDGGLPCAGVIQDAVGNLYGTALRGGAAGVVYKVDPSGHETVLYTFSGGADGGAPLAGVIRDADGNLYGTTSSGGAADWGVVYKLDTAGQETVLYSFTGGDDGGYPRAGVIRDTEGNLYGTTFNGGASHAGVVYKLNPEGQQQLLYTFTGGPDGGYPYAGVIIDPAGNLYGTAQVVYKLNRAGQETVLYSFTGGADGGSPIGGVIRDASGNLYGTGSYGGKYGGGVVFKLKPE